MRDKGKEAWRMEESDVECREVRWDRTVVRLQMELLGGVEGEEDST